MARPGCIPGAGMPISPPLAPRIPGHRPAGGSANVQVSDRRGSLCCRDCNGLLQASAPRRPGPGPSARSRGHGDPTTPGPRLSANVRLMQINAALRHASTMGTSRTQYSAGRTCTLRAILGDRSHAGLWRRALAMVDSPAAIASRLTERLAPSASQGRNTKRPVMATPARLENARGRQSNYAAAPRL